MTPFKNPLVAVGEALRKDAEIRRRQPLINPEESPRMSIQEPTPQPGTVVIYGAGDDLIEVEGQVRGCDEYNATDAQFVLTGAHDDGLAQTRLRVAYLPEGVWAISVAPVNEDVPMLPVFINQERYSAKATVAGVGSIVREAL